jgi:ribosome-binding protein aMBF1 (putative translation factor)
MDDSEIPDDYYDEEDDDEMDSMSDCDANGRGVLSQSSSSMSSVQESPKNHNQHHGQSEDIAGAYKMEDIDRIIKEAREQKRRML